MNKNDMPENLYDLYNSYRQHKMLFEFYQQFKQIKNINEIKDRIEYIKKHPAMQQRDEISTLLWVIGEAK